MGWGAAKLRLQNLRQNLSQSNNENNKKKKMGKKKRNIDISRTHAAVQRGMERNRNRNQNKQTKNVKD